LIFATSVIGFTLKPSEFPSNLTPPLPQTTLDHHAGLVDAPPIGFALCAVADESVH